MAQGLTQGPIQVVTNSPAEINQALVTITNILDELRGLRGRILTYDRIRAEAATASDDVVTLGTITSLLGEPFVVAAASTNLTAERVLTAETSVTTVTDNGATIGTIVVGVATNGIGNTKFRQGVATSVVGRSANSTGNVADIAASADGQVLRRAGGALGFGQIDLADATNAVSGVLDEANGGTGNSSYTTGDLLYASAATTLAKLADVATGNALISGGVGVAPSWGKIGLTTHVSGVLPIANGGTNSSTALNSNRIMVSSGGAIVEASALTNGQLLIGSTGAAPVAAALTAGSAITITNGAGSITVALTGTAQTYTETNVTTDRAFDADTVAIAELADVVGTLIADLRARGIVA